MQFKFISAFAWPVKQEFYTNQYTIHLYFLSLLLQSWSISVSHLLGFLINIFVIKFFIQVNCCECWQRVKIMTDWTPNN